MHHKSVINLKVMLSEADIEGLRHYPLSIFIKIPLNISQSQDSLPVMPYEHPYASQYVLKASCVRPHLYFKLYTCADTGTVPREL